MGMGRQLRDARHLLILTECVCRRTYNSLPLCTALFMQQLSCLAPDTAGHHYYTKNKSVSITYDWTYRKHNIQITHPIVVLLCLGLRPDAIGRS